MDGKKLEYKGEAAVVEIEKLTAEAGSVQEIILSEILAQNHKTEYLSRYLNGSKDVCDFKKLVPVITYKSIHPYIRRIANGEPSSLITGKPITEMLCSSGTSAGESKLMPSIAEDLDRRTFLYNLIVPIMSQYLPGLDEGKAMYLYFVKAETAAPCGLPIRTVLTSYYRSDHFRFRARSRYNNFTSPDEAILCNSSDQSMYCQLLSGLFYRHQVLQLGAVFASAFLRAVSFLERNWARMCNDIATGQLDAMVTDPECRSSMSNILSLPNPILAREITEICSCTSWEGILCRLWPRAKYIEAVVTGSMAQYIPALEYYSDRKIPLVCTMYASSECYFGVNLRPLCDPSEVVFTLLPNMGYFEFLPLGENGTLVMDVNEEEEVDSHKLVDLVNVKLGCYYELVVTTFAGLCRYRIGDVLQVAGFHNHAPQFRFICRRNVILSIDNDKTNEEDLHKSITAAAKKLLHPRGTLLVEYTSYADTSSVPGHYVLFWEIKTHCHHLLHKMPNNDDNDGSKHDNASANGEVIDGNLLEKCCIAVEEELDSVYRRCRSSDKSVGPLEIRVVEGGTFEKLMDLFIGQGGSINQYKTPRCIKSRDALALLDGNVKGSFFSPRDPTWRP